MATQTIQRASIGSISSGTLLSADLIDAFSDELRRLDVDGAHAKLLAEVEEWATRAERESFYELDDEETISATEELASDLVNQLQDALGEFAPPFCYFGTLEGDGADFGFWLDHDALQEAMDSGMRLIDGAYVTLDGYVIDISDHGNVEVYVMERGKSVLGIV